MVAAWRSSTRSAELVAGAGTVVSVVQAPAAVVVLERRDGVPPSVFVNHCLIVHWLPVVVRSAIRSSPYACTRVAPRTSCLNSMSPTFRRDDAVAELPRVELRVTTR